MMYRGKKVLLPEASGRQVLPMAQAFKKLGCEVHTVQEKKSDLGYSSRYPKKKYVVKGVDSSKKTAEEFYENLICQEKFDLIVPLSDFSASIFAEYKENYEQSSSGKIAVNEKSVFIKAFDKYKTMKICMENNIPCPYTLDDVSSAEDIDENIKYPVVVKPKSACGSIGFHIAHNREELLIYIEKCKKDNLGEILVQEFIPQNGKQYNAHFVMDKNHNVKTKLIAQKCRWFPIDGGASTLCRTMHDERISQICEKLLKTIGWVGYCDIDLMEDPRDGSVRVIEINARISANVKICFAAGIDIAKQLLQLYSGDVVQAFLDYKDDIRLRCMHTDLLWLIKSPDRFQTTPSWFSLKNTYDQIWSIKDPWPFFTFSVQSLLKYKREMKKRER